MTLDVFDFINIILSHYAYKEYIKTNTLVKNRRTMGRFAISYKIECKVVSISGIVLFACLGDKPITIILTRLPGSLYLLLFECFDQNSTCLPGNMLNLTAICILTVAYILINFLKFQWFFRIMVSNILCIEVCIHTFQMIL